MPIRLLLATRNAGKVREFEHLLGGMPELQVLTLRDVGETPLVIEDGDTFEHNARKKASELAQATGLHTLSDDSGLEVDALGGQPGVYSARYAGEGGTDEENNHKLVAQLRRLALPSERLTARYRVVLALAQPKGPPGAIVHLEHGTCEGRIRLTPRGNQGFGYDPYFEPKGYSCTMAELDLDEKNRISHRSQATRNMCRFLATYFAAKA